MSVEAAEILTKATERLLKQKQHWYDKWKAAEADGDERLVTIFSARAWAYHEAIEIVRGDREPQG